MKNRKEGEEYKKTPYTNFNNNTESIYVIVQ